MTAHHSSKKPVGQVFDLPTPTSALPIDALAGDVERVLCDLVAQIQRLTALAHERREALRRADAPCLARCIAAENDAVQAVADIEKRRLTVVARLADRLGEPGKAHAKITALGERLGGAIGERLAARARELKDLIDSLKRLNESSRAAAATLAAHMEGLWRQAAQVLNHSKTYGRLGVVAPGSAVISAVDLRS
jgi:hypothetical protein